MCYPLDHTFGRWSTICSWTSNDLLTRQTVHWPLAMCVRHHTCNVAHMISVILFTCWQGITLSHTISDEHQALSVVVGTIFKVFGMAWPGVGTLDLPAACQMLERKCGRAVSVNALHAEVPRSIPTCAGCSFSRGGCICSCDVRVLGFLVYCHAVDL